jgi:hypothetical protein
LSLNRTPSPGLEPRIVFRGCGLCSCNLLAETNNFGLGAVLLSCLVSELQEPSSPGLELRTLFRSLTLLRSFLVSRNKHAKFRGNRFVRSRARSTHNFNFLYKIKLHPCECWLGSCSHHRILKHLKDSSSRNLFPELLVVITSVGGQPETFRDGTCTLQNQLHSSGRLSEACILAVRTLEYARLSCTLLIGRVQKVNSQCPLVSDSVITLHLLNRVCIYQTMPNS